MKYSGHKTLFRIAITLWTIVVFLLGLCIGLFSWVEKLEHGISALYLETETVLVQGLFNQDQP